MTRTPTQAEIEAAAADPRVPTHIWLLFGEGENGEHVWCDDPCPTGYSENHDAVAYVQARIGYDPIAAAYLAGRREMREEAARACEDQEKSFLSPEYATHQPSSTARERFACGQCAATIRALPDEPEGGQDALGRTPGPEAR